MTNPAQPPPCVLHEDEHLLAVNKPPGWNTHAADPLGGEGIYEWLRHRELRWRSLGIVQRLDKETSGVMVFTRSRTANQSLSRQWSERAVAKQYTFLTDRPATFESQERRSVILRDGERYRSASTGAGTDLAVTKFERAGEENGFFRWKAYPLTGRTHQIRVHASDLGIPILGDALYGGTAHDRVCLHAERLEIEHPTGGRMEFAAPAAFASGRVDPVRQAIIDSSETNAFRLMHGAADGEAGFQADRFERFLLTQAEDALTPLQRKLARDLMERWALKGHYHKRLDRRVRTTAPESAGPEWISGDRAPERFEVCENGVRYELSFEEGYSVGIFLDQRDNRRRLSRGMLGDAPFPAAGVEVLNTFSYTCAFSVCAALTGARVTSLDLSRKYLDWGRRNFELNALEPAAHDFIYGDAFDWMRRLEKKGRRFGLVMLDPPTFSQAKKGSVFRAEKDYAALVRLAAGLLGPGGMLFASTNAGRVDAQTFCDTVSTALSDARRAIESTVFHPQPPDFPITRDEPAHLKTLWVRLNS